MSENDQFRAVGSQLDSRAQEDAIKVYGFDAGPVAIDVKPE